VADGVYMTTKAKGDNVCVDGYRDRQHDLPHALAYQSQRSISTRAKADDTPGQGYSHKIGTRGSHPTKDLCHEIACSIIGAEGR
jgi:hypothetical protein